MLIASAHGGGACPSACGCALYRMSSGTASNLRGQMLHARQYFRDVPCINVSHIRHFVFIPLPGWGWYRLQFLIFMSHQTRQASEQNLCRMFRGVTLCLQPGRAHFIAGLRPIRYELLDPYGEPTPRHARRNFRARRRYHLELAAPGRHDQGGRNTGYCSQAPNPVQR